MNIQATAMTVTGRRKNNQDACIVDHDIGLFAVADGMGGYAGGEVASNLAISSLSRFVARNKSDDNVTWPYGIDQALSLSENMLVVGAHLAHDTIVSHRTGALSQMGTTLAAIVVFGDSAVISHIGDSRVYRLRDSTLEQLTVDHSLAEELRAGGHPVPDPENWPYAHVVTRALGGVGPADVKTEALFAGDRYLVHRRPERCPRPRRNRRSARHR